MNQNKVILITGGASGIGKYLAEALYTQGHSLILTDVDDKKIQANAKQKLWKAEQVLIAKLDVAQVQDWQSVCRQALSRWRHIDVLFNVAGVITPGYIHETPFDNINYHIDINLKGAIYGTKILSEHMVKQGGGQIINIASLAGISPVQGLSLYSASKFGLRGFSLAIASELRKYKIFVSVVCPDVVDTPMLTQQLDYQEAALTFSGDKILTPREIGDIIINRALYRRQLEVVYPISRGRLAFLSNIFPSLGRSFLSRYLTRKGDKKRERLRKN